MINANKNFIIYHRHLSSSTSSTCGFADLEPDGLGEGRRNGVSDLPVFLCDPPVKLVIVRKSLTPGALPDGHDSVVFRVQHLTLFAGRIRTGDGGAEMPAPVNPAEASGPVVVSVGGVTQTPRN